MNLTSSRVQKVGQLNLRARFSLYERPEVEMEKMCQSRKEIKNVDVREYQINIPLWIHRRNSYAKR